MHSSLRLAAACLLLPAPLALARAAKVLGPQSPAEEYPAPVAKQVATTEFIHVVETDLTKKAGPARSQVNTPGLSTAELEARAKLWGSG